MNAINEPEWGQHIRINPSALVENAMGSFNDNGPNSALGNNGVIFY